MYSASRCILQVTVYILKAGCVQCITVYFAGNSVGYILKAGRVQCTTMYFAGNSVYTEGGACTVHHDVFCRQQCI